MGLTVPSIKITTGAADTKMLVSDADGDASWATSTSVGCDLLSVLVYSELSITGADTATISKMHVCSGTTSDYTVTLPAASGNAGKFIGFRMSPDLTKLVTLDGNASEKIDGALTRIMWANESAILMCDGSNWFKVGGKSIPMEARLQLGSEQNFNAATLTLIGYTTLNYSNCPAAFVDAANAKITCLRPYTLDMKSSVGYYNTNSTATYISLYVWQNGTPPSGSQTLYSYTAAPASSYTYCVCHGLVPAAVGDYYYGYTLFGAGSYSPQAITNFTYYTTLWSVSEVCRW